MAMSRLDKQCQGKAEQGGDLQRGARAMMSEAKAKHRNDWQ